MKMQFTYNIFLIGFMGSGKSTVADYLCEKFDMDVVEMDQVIAERERMSISDIFEKHGELYFRDLETKLLVELQEKTNTVVSCGGGVALRVEIYDKHLFAQRRYAGRKVDSGGGFAHSALLVCDRYNFCHALFFLPGKDLFHMEHAVVPAGFPVRQAPWLLV